MKWNDLRTETLGCSLLTLLFDNGEWRVTLIE
jgi:hypothetical protein